MLNLVALEKPEEEASLLHNIKKIKKHFDSNKI